MTKKDLGRVAIDLAAELDPALAASWAPRYNVAPGQAHVVLRLDERRKRLVPALWGFPGERKRLINARAETAAEKRTFREAFAARRCVIPADGFFEWTGPEGRRRPIWFHAPGDALLLFAGLWDRDGDGVAFTILTTDANEIVAPVHDRMPVLLPRERADDWLRRPAAELLAPAPPGWLVATPVSPRVNGVLHDDPACLAPAPEPEPEPEPEPPRQPKLL